jgi:hypothetical protein
MKTIEIKSKRVIDNKKYYIITYRVTVPDNQETEVTKLLNTAVIFNPQELYKLLYTKYDSRLVSTSRKKV